MVYDIIIIGAGISGLSAAYFLQRYDFKIAVLEQKKEIGKPVICGEAVSENILKNLNILDDSFIDKKINGFRVFSPNNNSFYVNTNGFLINREKFEKYLYKNISNVDFHFKNKVLDIQFNGNNFKIITSDYEFSSKILIGADGPFSIVDRLFFKNKLNLINAIQYKLPKNYFKYKFHSENFIDFFYTQFSNYYFWVFEKNDEFNVGGAVKDKEILKKFINEYFLFSDFKYNLFSRGFIPVSGIKKTINTDKIFLIGDAASLTNPVSFAGIYSALLSGKIVSDTIYNFYSTKNFKYIKNYKKTLKRTLFLNSFINFISKNCYNFNEETLNFIGNYFEGDYFRKKDFLKFFKLLFKHPFILNDIIPLIMHRELLRYFVNRIW